MTGFRLLRVNQTLFSKYPSMETVRSIIIQNDSDGYLNVNSLNSEMLLVCMDNG